MKAHLTIAAVTAVFLTTLPARADYPLIHHRYIADPCGIEVNGELYIFGSNDDDNTTANYLMHSIVCISSTDLKNWTDHGLVFNVPANCSWATRSWAPQVVARNGKFYLFFSAGGGSIGVASSTSIAGTYTDAKGGSLISTSTPGASGTTLLDPGCLIDDDGQAYLTFGGGGSTTQTDNARIIKLNSDMISVNGSASVVPAPNFFEASYIHKYNGRYYFSYESIPNVGMDIYYGVGASPMSGYSWKGRVMNSPYNSNNEQAAFFPYQGLWYVVYHNRYVSNGDTYHRNVCLDRIAYNSDGTIQTVTCTQDGLTQLKKVNPYNKVEAETMADDSGIETDVTFDTGGGMKVISLDSGNWIRVRGVDFTSTAAHSINTRVYANATGGAMEVRIDSTTGTRLGTVSIPNTSGAWTTVTTSISSVTGVHDIYFKVTGAFGGFNWWQFSH